MASLSKAFHVGQFNAHYVGSYSPRSMEWRRLGALDKSRNIKHILGSRAVEVESVLEVGCGTGAVLNEVVAARIGRKHIGIDIADPAEHAELPIDTSIVLQRYDGQTIPYADGEFDLVLASHVLEHVEDERGFLRELARVSRKFIYIEVPCELHLRTTHDALQTTLNIGHINSYTPKSFALTLQTAGLHLEDIRLFDHSLPIQSFHKSKLKAIPAAFLRKLALAVSEGLASQLFTYHCGALCTVQRQ